MDIVVGTRFFESKPENAAAALEKIMKFCENALSAGAKAVLIAVNEEEDRSRLLQERLSGTVFAFPVRPWGKFVLPLNALLLKGRPYWASGAWLLLASAEIALSKKAVETLAAHTPKNEITGQSTLVVGAALEGHCYETGSFEWMCHIKASGRQVPWNTLALWDPKLLWTYGGFPIIGDGPVDAPECAGVEEVITIASIQRACPDTVRAKLIRVPGQTWNTANLTADRRAQHEKKMASKVERPAAQMAAAQVNGQFPLVWHINNAEDLK